VFDPVETIQPSLLFLCKGKSPKNSSSWIWVDQRTTLKYWTRLSARKPLQKGKVHYSWPPCTNLFRSAPFYIENIIYIFNKTSYLNEEFNRTEPSHSVSIPRLVYLSKVSDEVEKSFITSTAGCSRKRALTWLASTNNFGMHFLDGKLARFARKNDSRYVLKWCYFWLHWRLRREAERSVFKGHLRCFYTLGRKVNLKRRCVTSWVAFTISPWLVTKWSSSQGKAHSLTLK